MLVEFRFFGICCFDYRIHLGSPGERAVKRVCVCDYRIPLVSEFIVKGGYC